MSEWQCQECGYRGGEFRLLGDGFLRCPKCDTLHFLFDKFPPKKVKEKVIMRY